ncbi:hypothetical protein QO207_27765 [Pseudomonas sp. CAN2814]|uniref:hypothetical protein n=1 Tax=Pseudomonas sp. CAN1 TaxID=3046726 RepID=UPI0026472826|nr:hypothetical protein [Pseudomonas sp. CAN1]MDN6860405.1 hypothetical protein [Pseudomonas sp. CAN1]
MNRTALVLCASLLSTTFTTLPASADDAVSRVFLRDRVFELRTPTCVEWPVGLPDGAWGNGGDFGPETATLFDKGQVLVVSAEQRASGERVSHRFYKSREACQADLARPPAPPTRTRAVASKDDGLTYVQRLQRDYGQRLHFSSPQAEEVVRQINIDCRANDGRYLPLYNALLARLDEARVDDAWMETRVVNAGRNIKVFDTIHIQGGKPRVPQLIFEINEWGAVTTHQGVRSDALENACFGSYGPIWQF